MLQPQRFKSQIIESRFQTLLLAKIPELIPILRYCLFLNIKQCKGLILKGKCIQKCAKQLHITNLLTIHQKVELNPSEVPGSRRYKEKVERLKQARISLCLPRVKLRRTGRTFGLNLLYPKILRYDPQVLLPAIALTPRFTA